MIFIAIFFVLVYSILMVVFIVIWKNQSFEVNHFNNPSNTEFSIIIPVRNESKNVRKLLESIVNQNEKNFEVILIDDSSEDDTVKIAEAFLALLDLKILYLSNEERGNAPKKNAITKAIGVAKHDLIFCTDGDCVLPTKLLAKYAEIFNNERIKLISGPVTFFESGGGFFNKIWEKVQIVEFASLVGSAAVSIFLGKPNMCSGANIAYRKSAFMDVNGYDGNNELASGDDEFLMHKIQHKYTDGVFFAKSKEAIVETNTCESVVAFYNQRKRWASKWTKYDSYLPKLIAMFVFVVNLFTIYLTISGLWSILAIRYVFEFIFLALVLGFLKKKSSILFILIVQIFYPLYVVFFGLNSLFMNKNYNWKGRKLQ
ncbi:glycosyltransferase [Lacihabitans sp. CCS-44]|uniref:glycosyltransferase n=1 Tax=Lacihabitans sp. CCS-44 TaxID=2487331 RepID=UPI0020CC3A1A|nr:glycosyltransferase [Lacihabitans sp. CCS-44]MCP9755083.1 glycosyltransferase [Lacihabitans sp. CCS-44]